MANPASDKIPPPENGALAALLSYLVPGLGQIYQGRIGKGVLFFVCIYTLFFYGMYLGSWRNVYMPDTIGENRDPHNPNNPWNLPKPLANLYNRPHFVGQFWVGIASWPAVYQYNVYDHKDDDSPPLHNFERQPPEDELQKLQRDGDKTWDLAWVYTVIAGVLNVMVIYDAFAGPAFVVRPDRREEQPSHATATTAR